MSMQELMDQLNDQQREAVLINEGSLLVFAGAGSGKTRVITTKIAYAIDQLGVKPYRILAVTFTNKACKEMQDRVVSMIGDAGQGVMIRTFHSFGVWLLRKYGHMVGLDQNFKIYDDEDSVNLLCQAFPNVDKTYLRKEYKKIALLKDAMKKPPIDDTELGKYFYAYKEALSRSKNVDFADMIIKSIELLEQNPSVKDEIQKRFSMILVDEYQDSNDAQALLLNNLVGPETFICAVGDDDQSIYRFRGADVKNILSFKRSFRRNHPKEIVLGMNYRCSEAILNVANDVISNNTDRAPKRLEASNKGGIKPKLIHVENGYDEADRVIALLKSYREKDINAFSNSAIIYRTNDQSRIFEDKLAINQIPYHLVGSVRFYDREEVRDCISLISLINNPNDSVAFQRMINKPPRKIGEKSIATILSIGLENESINGDMILASKIAIDEKAIKGPAVEGIKEFIKAFERCKESFGSKKNGDYLKEVANTFGLVNYYGKRDSIESKLNSRTDNISQLVNKLNEDEFCEGQDGLNSFLEIASLDSSSLGEEGQNQTGVTLITMHNTKGLEYVYVFLVGMENEIIPKVSSELASFDPDVKMELEEERRICYVAMTRAKRELNIFCASNRLRWGSTHTETPSVFLREINPSHIEEIDYTLKRYSSKQKFDFRGSSDYRTGYGNGFGNSYTSRFGSPGKYSSSYVNTSRTDDEVPASKPKVVGISKYNLKNLRQQNEAKQAPSKPAQVPGTVTYNVGDRIRSDFYGEGTISGKRTFAGREVLDVKFDSGRTGTFASDKVAFEKI